MNFAEKPKPVAYCAGCSMPASIEVVRTSCRNGDCNGTYKGAGAATNGCGAPPVMAPARWGLRFAKPVTGPDGHRYALEPIHSFNPNRHNNCRDLWLWRWTHSEVSGHV